MNVRIQILRDDGTVLEDRTFPAFAVCDRLEALNGHKDGDGDWRNDGPELLGFVFAPKMRTTDGKVLTPRVTYSS